MKLQYVISMGSLPTQRVPSNISRHDYQDSEKQRRNSFEIPKVLAQNSHFKSLQETSNKTLNISPILSQICSVRTVSKLKSIASSKKVVGKNKAPSHNQNGSKSFVGSEQRAIRKNFGNSCKEMKTRIDSLLEFKK